MDTTKTITHLGLCAGYGGIELGLKRVLPTLRTVALCEIEAFACANLVAKMEAGFMDPAPIWTDLKTFPWAEFRDRVDILTGGYPCQPFSAAGKRLGAEDPRHLWPYIADGIRLLRPRVCFFENVEGHISLGLREVIAELEELGYTTTWGIFSASEVGAPHQRKRVFIMAHRSGEGLQGDIARLLVQSRRQMPSGSTAGSGGSSRSGELADSDSAGGRQDWQSSQSWAASVEQSSCLERRGDSGEICEGQAWPSRPGEPQHAWEPPRVVGNTENNRRCGSGLSVRSGGSCEAAVDATRTGKSMGNPKVVRTQGKWPEQQTAGFMQSSCFNAVGYKCNRQTQSSLGRDADGPAGGLVYAELCVSCDNRTDELRLLGNGVVPATAERAFRTLLAQI